MDKLNTTGASSLIFLILLGTNYVDSKSVDVGKPGGVVAKDGKPVEDAAFWRAKAIADLNKKVKEQRIMGEAKNVIMFLGDGWDIQTLTAARILKGQKVDKLAFGEEADLYLDSFPYTGLSKTYCVDDQVADSACSVTAYLGGVKTNSGVIGVTPNVQLNDCPGQNIKENQVISILAHAQAAGKSTGIVTTTAITDASPAGTYAHVANRNWECDADVKRIGNNDPNVCIDIASQMILGDPGRNITVILGGGRAKFLPNDVKDSEGFPGQRQDGKNLLETWKSQKAALGLNAVYVENANDLDVVDTKTTDTLLGLFATTNIAYYNDRKENGDPLLADMVQKAIEILSKNDKGFFLFVEGGRIDHGHHANQAQRALWETYDFDEAIKMGDNLTKDEETLVLITADHGHTMSFAGYPARGNPIMGIAGMGDDNLPFSTLNYANGPGFKPFVNNTRYNISQDDLESLTNTQVPLVPVVDESHGGQDVQILGKGPMAHLLGGIHEQNFIAYLMGYAACIGDGPKVCDEKPYVNAQASIGQWHATTGA